VGTSLGSFLAQSAGYALTFALSAVVLAPALWLGFKCAPQGYGTAAAGQTGDIDDIDGEEEKGKEAKEMSGARFFINRSVFSFLIFMMFPFLTIMYFKDFVFPLFASEQGLSEVGIGQTLLFTGAAAILIAPPLLAALTKRLSAKSVNILTAALFAAGLLLFAFMPTLMSSIITVSVITVAGAIGLITQSVYFSSLRVFKLYGAGKSMSIYSLFDNLSQTAGPLLFGAALILGYRTAALVIGLASAVLLVLFALISETDRIKAKKDRKDK